MHPLLRVPYAALAAAAELAVALAPRDAPRHAKWRRTLSARHGLAERLRAFASRRDASKPLVWLHAPSVGEALMALPVLDALRGRTPATQTAFTWFSPSMESFADRFDADFRDYLAFDTASAARTALDALRPTALVYSKLDVWPVLTEHAAHRGVRLGLIAAALSPASGRRGRAARALLSDAYARLDLVGAASPDDAARLVALGVRADAVSVTGDTRYDQVWERAERLSRTAPPIVTLKNERPTVVAGSTWPADEAVLGESWEIVRRKLPRARLVVAPHEPSGLHVAALEEWALRAGLSVARASNADAASDADVIVIDRIGVLADLYAIGDCAYVGGGFHGRGLHSVLEPAAFGLPVAFGRAWPASRDASGLVASGGGRAVGTAGELASALLRWLEHPAERESAGAAARDFVRAGLGAAARTLSLVERLLG